MATAKPCKHSRRTVTAQRATTFDVAGFERWRVIEDLTCVKCGNVAHRWSRKGYGASTEREALRRYGVATEDLPVPPRHKDKPAVAVPLSCWPFPVSTVFPKGARHGQ